ncbi:MAG TPA: UbiD family decarboxylase [Chloroflexota bacterium]|nr:UbiD family decarboxylase [Chloroflexota bacterium]
MVATHVGALDTRFRTALERLDAAERLLKVRSRVDPELEVAGLVKQRDGDLAFYFADVAGHPMPVAANFLASPANVTTVFGLDTDGVRAVMERGIRAPLPCATAADGPVQERVRLGGEVDLGEQLPILRHTARDAGRYVTAGCVIARDPETGVHNASFHRLQLRGPRSLAIRLDHGRHLRALWQKAAARGESLEVAVVVGGDVALTYAACSLGAMLPLDRDELEAASGLRGAPLELVPCRTVDLAAPADAEIVLEGAISTDEFVEEGPFVEFLGLYSEVGPSPLVEVRALTHRHDAIYYAIVGCESYMLRKYILEAGILSQLKQAVPIVRDVALTRGGLCRFHLVISVHKQEPGDEGLQRNAIFAAVAALKDLDQVIVVDDDIDIHDPTDVEYAVATRVEASKDILLLPGARGHEYILVSDHGIRTKVGIDATVPVQRRDEFRRAQYAAVDLAAHDTATSPSGALPRPAARP